MPNSNDRYGALRAGIPEDLYRRCEKAAEKEGRSFNDWLLSLCSEACDASQSQTSRKGKRSA